MEIPLKHPVLTSAGEGKWINEPLVRWVSTSPSSKVPADQNLCSAKHVNNSSRLTEPPRDVTSFVTTLLENKRGKNLARVSVSQSPSPRGISHNFSPQPSLRFPAYLQSTFLQCHRTFPTVLCKTNSCYPSTCANQILPSSFLLKTGVTLPISWYWHCRAGLLIPTIAIKTTPGTTKATEKASLDSEVFPLAKFLKFRWDELPSSTWVNRAVLQSKAGQKQEI